MSDFRCLRRLLLAALFGLLTGTASAADLRIGVLAWLDASEAEIQWAPFVAALQAQLPQHRLIARHMDLGQMSEAIGRGELDFVVTNPGHYVALEARHGITRIATQVSVSERNPAHVVGSAVVVLAGRQELQTLQDLKGRSLAAVSPDAFGGYQIVWAELKRLGVDPEAGDVEPKFTGFPMFRVLETVAAGQADAGVVRACLLEQLERQGSVPAGRFRVLSAQASAGDCRISSARYPGWAFAATRTTPPELSREVLFALLSLPPDSDGQSWSVPADYHPVHQMLRELEIGPYAFLRETAWESLARRYWPGVAILFGLLIVWLLYTVRVEHLVHRRTRELSSALQERERLELRVRTHQQQMDHLSRLSILGELAGTLAHELNQPLAAIGNYARSLIRRQARGNLSPEAVHQAAEEIAQESERAAGILAGIRSFARKRAHVRESCQPVALVREAVALFAGILPQVPVLQLDDRLPVDAGAVSVDPRQIQQVLLNLLKNACDAQRDAGIEAPIIIALSAVDGRCRIEVIDRGPGLGPEQQAQLFEAFFTTKPEGLGLGLSICKTIVEAHGGTLEAVPNQPGPGLSFRFSLSWLDNPVISPDPAP